MKALIGVVAVFCFVVWDLTLGHGAWTRLIVGLVFGALRYLF
jgi:hypothetical protein